VQDEVDRASRIIGHNIKFDLHWLRHVGVCFDRAMLYDTLVADVKDTFAKAGKTLPESTGPIGWFRNMLNAIKI
jgi:hypothetical protein